MGVPVTARRQIFNTESGNRSRFRSEIGTINDNEFFCHFRVKEGKNKMRAAKACIYYAYIVGKCEFLQLLDYRRSESVISEQGISAPCNHDLWI